jgi:hypothetical protein
LSTKFKVIFNAEIEAYQLYRVRGSRKVLVPKIQSTDREHMEFVALFLTLNSDYKSLKESVKVFLDLFAGQQHAVLDGELATAIEKLRCRLEEIS